MNVMKATSLTAALILISGSYSLYACSGCGCSAQASESKTSKADLEASSVTNQVDVKKDAECASGVCSLSEAKSSAEKNLDDHVVSTVQLKGYIDSGKAILLDARSGKYDDGFRIPGAKSLSSTSTAEEVGKIIPAKDSLVITYCSNLQCPASKRLAEHLEKLGYTKIHEYPEGIAGWREAGGTVEKAK